MAFTTITKLDTGDWKGIGYYKTSTGAQFSIVAYPTHNCQMSCIGQAENLLYSSEALIVLKQIKLDSNLKNQLLFDIRDVDSLTTKMELLFKDKIIFRQSYISTNGRDMIMYLIDINNL